MSEHKLVSFPGAYPIDTTIYLTGSKSECNRALIIHAASKGRVQIQNLGIAADTVVLQQVLNALQDGVETTLKRINIGPAGTAMRFLTAYLSTQEGSFELTGTERMQQRPIATLVDALVGLGAHISYLKQEGYPPLQINGPLTQTNQHIHIKGDISSQYISALLMIAPTLPQGLTLHIDGDLTSRPYVEMTLALLTQTGIQHRWQGNEITIEPQDFQQTSIYVEPDWSAASYWYCIAALADTAKIFLPGLKQHSLQGDSVISKIMQNFGIQSTFQSDGVLIEKIDTQFVDQVYDMKACPDLAQTIVVLCAALGYNATFTGLETLKIKETNRVKALQNELAKMGVQFIENGLFYQLDCTNLNLSNPITIATYEDHRMAMAFAPLALKVNTIQIEDAQVVEKSYPNYWIDLEKAGFKVVPQ